MTSSCVENALLCDWNKLILTCRDHDTEILCALNENALCSELHGSTIVESRQTDDGKVILSLVVKTQKHAYSTYAICKLGVTERGSLEFIESAVVKDPLFDVLHTILLYKREKLMRGIAAELDALLEEWIKKTFVSVRYRLNRHTTLNLLAKGTTTDQSQSTTSTVPQTKGNDLGVQEEEGNNVVIQEEDTQDEPPSLPDYTQASLFAESMLTSETTVRRHGVLNI